MQVQKKSIVKAWLHAFRLRTLPLSLSGILLGAFLAYFDGKLNIQVSCLAFFTTLALQILSNLANDYGDAVKGTDNENRVGPERAVQSGLISLKQMKKAIYLFSFLSLFSGLILLYFAFSRLDASFPWMKFAFFLGLGLAAIAAAIKYTVGKGAYGYHGWGDVFVFIFFGLASVGGTYFLNALDWNWLILLPATSVGLYSVAVLNLNNMRDRANDEASGKYTLVVKMGLQKSKIYHFCLLLGGLSAMLTFSFLQFISYWQFLFILLIPFMAKDIYQIFMTKEEALIDAFLKKQAIKTLVFCLLVGLGFFLALQ